MGRWFNRQQLGGAQSGKPPRDGRAGAPARPAPRGLPATVAEQRTDYSSAPQVPDGFDWRTANIDGPVDPRAAMSPHVIEAKEVGPLSADPALQARRDAIMAALPELREFLEHGGSPTFEPPSGGTAESSRFQPPSQPYGAEAYRSGHVAPEPPRADPYAGPVPRHDQYAAQARHDQYGAQPQADHYGGRPQPDQYGSPVPRPDQYGARPQADQYVGRPQPDPYGVPAPRHDQYGAHPSHADAYGYSAPAESAVRLTGQRG